MVAAAVERDDLQPLVDAYRGEVTLERMQEIWTSRKSNLELEFGALTGYKVLGTALRNGRDVTVVRHIFEHGYNDFAYVWDPIKPQYLLGRSTRGLSPALHFVPTGELSFGSWDGGFSDSRPLRFSEAGKSLSLGDAAGNAVIAVRVATPLTEKPN
jgi:hypothetical protein